MKILQQLNQKGFTLLEGLIAAILIAIVAALAFGWYSAQAEMEARKCINDVLSIQAYERQWWASVRAGNPDKAICKQVNSRVDQYNATCGEDYGMLPTIPCDDF